MKIYKAVFLATVFLGASSLSWASHTGDDADIQPVKQKRAMGFKPTSEKTMTEIKSHKKLMGLRAPAPSTTPLPKEVDLSRYCKIMNQGGLGSCTSFALAGQMFMRQAMQLEEKGKTLPKIMAKQEPVSHLFIYWEERNLEGSVNEDAGASIGDGILTLYKKGAPREKFWTYDDRTESDDPKVLPKFIQRPSAEAYANAKENRDLDGIATDLIKPNGRKYDLSQIKRAIFDKQPLSLGIMLYDSFQSEVVARTGIVPMPKRGENVIGGHAVLAVGYSDAKKWVKFANSWDVTWGDKGYFYLPYDYFTTDLVSEVWKMGTVSVQNIPLRLNPSHANDNQVAAINNGDKGKEEDDKIA